MMVRTGRLLSALSKLEPRRSSNRFRCEGSRGTAFIPARSPALWMLVASLTPLSSRVHEISTLVAEPGVHPLAASSKGSSQRLGLGQPVNDCLQDVPAGAAMTPTV